MPVKTRVPSTEKKPLDTNVVSMVKYTVRNKDGEEVEVPSPSAQLKKFQGNKSYLEGQFKILAPTGVQVLFDTVSHMNVPSNHNLYGKAKQKQGLPWLPPWEEDLPPASNASTYKRSDSRKAREKRDSRKSLIPYTPNDPRFFQNLCPDLKSRFDYVTPRPKNLYVLFKDKEKHIKNSMWAKAHRKKAGKPRFMREEIEDWQSVRARNLDLYPDYYPSSDFTWDRPPSIGDLLSLEYKEGYSFSVVKHKDKPVILSPDLWEKLNNPLSVTKPPKVQEDIAEDSEFDISECYPSSKLAIEVERENALILYEHSPPVACKEVHITKILNSRDESLPYYNWHLQNTSGYRSPNLPYLASLHTSPMNIPDLTHHINAGKWEKVRKEHSCEEYIFGDKSKYENWLEKVAPFNPHVDYLPGKVRSVIDGKAWHLGERIPDYNAYPEMPVQRYILSDFKTKVRISSRGNCFIKTVERTDLNCREFKWLRYTNYLKSYDEGKIEYDQLEYARDCIYNNDLTTWLVDQLPGSVFGYDREDESKKFLAAFKTRVTSQNIVDKKLKEVLSKRYDDDYKKERQPNWSEVQVRQAQEIVLTPPPSTLVNLESLVMRRAERKFIKTTLGILLPEYCAKQEGIFTLSEEDEAINKMVGNLYTK